MMIIKINMLFRVCFFLKAMYISPLKVEGIFFDLLDHKSASSLTDKYLTRTV